MKGISIAVFFCLLFSSLFAEEISSANNENSELIYAENLANVCGEGFLNYDFTDAALCEPTLSSYITFYSNGTFAVGTSYGTWNSDGTTVINWSFSLVSTNDLVTVYIGEISNGKMSGTSRSYLQECGCWSADFPITCTPNCLANY